MQRIYVTIANVDFESALSIAKQYSDIELRLDMLNLDFEDLTSIVKESKISIISHHVIGDKEKLYDNIKYALLAKPSIIDLDINIEADFIRDTIREAAKLGVKVLLSFHDFNKTPDIEIFKIVINSMEEYSPNIYKIVTKANTNKDILRLMSLYNLYSDRNLVAFGLGDSAKFTRLVAYKLSGFAYAYPDEYQAVAEGQLPYSDFKRLTELL